MTGYEQVLLRNVFEGEQLRNGNTFINMRKISPKFILVRMFTPDDKIVTEKWSVYSKVWVKTRNVNNAEITLF